MPLYACNGCVTDLFVTDEELIDRFTGKELFLFGANLGGGLGDQTSIGRSSPVQTISGGTNWKQISVACNSAAIKTDGTLWLWGINANGQLGNQDNPAVTVARSSPVQTVSGGTNWKQVSVGVGVIGAIKTDGTLWLWGQNLVGRIGTNNTIDQSSPVQTISAGTNWKKLSVGQTSITAIKTDNTLWTWGNGTEGRLGNHQIVNSSSPVQTVSGGTNWKFVSTGGYHSAAIKTDGTLWLWGRNGVGELGNSTVISRSSPVQTVSGGTNWKSVSSGRDITTSIKTDGTLWLWGFGSGGILGNNFTTNRSSPVQTVSGGTNWKLPMGGTSSAGGVKTDGTLWLWGAIIGDNTIIAKSSPVQTISGGTNWRDACFGFINAATRTTEF